MEYQKIINLLDNTNNRPSKFRKSNKLNRIKPIESKSNQFQNQDTEAKSL